MGRWRYRRNDNRDELTVHEAVYALLMASDIRLSEVASRTGIPYDTLKSWKAEPDNPSGAYRAMPVHQVAPITRATGNMVLLETLATACEAVVYTLPEVAHPTKDLLLELAKVAREFGEMVSVTAHAIEDRGISAGEMDAIDHRVDHVIQSALRVREAAKQIHLTPAHEAQGR